VAYYVGDHFTQEVSAAKLRSVERAVEDDFVSNLRNNCWKEKQQSTSVLKSIKSHFHSFTSHQYYINKMFFEPLHLHLH